MDHRINLKECEKKDKYLDLARELKKLWNMKVMIVLDDWRLEKTCCHSNSCEKPSAKTDVKNSKEENNYNNNDLWTNIPTNDITELNDLIYAGAKLVSKKNQGPFEDLRQKVKTRVGTQTWITDKETTTRSKNTKTEH